MRIVLSGAGLARFSGGNMETESILMATNVGVTGGSIDFMAPEQAIDFSHADVRADIYSLGRTFAFLVAGHDFIGDASPEQKFRAIIRGGMQAPDRLESIHDDIPEGAQSIYRKLVAREPNDRFQSMEEAIEQLAAYL